MAMIRDIIFKSPINIVPCVFFAMDTAVYLDLTASCRDCVPTLEISSLEISLASGSVSSSRLESGGDTELELTTYVPQPAHHPIEYGWANSTFPCQIKYLSI